MSIIRAGGIIMWFGNLRLIFAAPTFSEKVEAFGKVAVSVIALAFIAAAFSDVIPEVPEAYTVATGGTLGLLIGGAKFAA
jgi:hypothetical protein